MKSVLQIGPGPDHCITTQSNHVLAGFESGTEINPQEIRDVSSCIQLPTKLLSFALSRDVAESFQLTNLQFAKCSQMMAIGAISFKNFVVYDLDEHGQKRTTDHARVPVALGGPFACFNPIRVGSDVTLQVENIGDKPKRFMACAILEPFEDPRKDLDEIDELAGLLRDRPRWADPERPYQGRESDTKGRIQYHLKEALRLFRFQSY